MDYPDSSGSSDSDNDDWVLPILLILVAHQREQPRIATNRLWTGPEYVNNLLNCGNLTRIHNILRMNLETFYLLRDWLVSNTKLKSSRKVAVEEKLLIFITIASSIELSRVITREPC